MLLRLGATPTASLDILPRGIARFRKARPDVRLVVAEGSVSQLWAELGDGSIDALLAPLPGAGQDVQLPPGLTYHAVGNERLVLVAPLAHPMARRRADATLLAAQDWVLPPSGSLARLTLEAWFASAGMQAPPVSVTSISFFTSLRLAATCGMLKIAPAAAARAHAAVLKLKVIRAPWQHPRGDIVFACRTSALCNPRVETLQRSFPASNPARG